MKKVLFTGLLIAVTGMAMASDGDELTSLSYIAYLERYATVLPASQDEKLEAAINMPLVAGDRVDTAREGRMEVVLADGNTMWLDEYTTLSLDAVAFSRDSEAERTVIFLAEGSIIVEISEHTLSSQPVRIDGQSATVYLDDQGLYRLFSLPSGGIRVEVMSGLAEAATVSGGVLVRAETSAEVAGGQMQSSEAPLTWNDDFAAWVEMRRQTVAGESSKYVDLRYSRQAAQLDSYGSWVYVDSINSWAWQPSVAANWRPYQAGRWYWTSTGYAWISYEPWGWLPYHYGSWQFDGGFGWVWSWGRYWGPSWVSWMWWPGYVGWCPYGYYNSWYWPHYGHHYPGYYPPHNRPPYPGGGGGSAQPPRRDVMPSPRQASGRVGDGSAQPRNGARDALDLNGRTRLASVDTRGWTVVDQDNFASPDLTRHAKPGGRVIPTGDEIGVVYSGPLATRRPTQGDAGAEIERVFRRAEVMSTTDISPLMARDTTLSPETARVIGHRTDLASLGQGADLGSSGQGVTEAASSGRQTVAPRLSAGAGSPFSSSSTSRLAQPNLYRPNMYTGRGSAGGTSRGSRTLGGRQPVTPSTGSQTVGGRQPVTPRTSSGRVGSSRPVIVPPTTSTLGGQSLGRSGSSPTTSRSVGSRSSSSIRSPSGRTVAPRSSSPRRSGSSSVGSRSSAGSSRPSSGSTRSSGGRVSSSRSSSGGSKSSGTSKTSGTSKR